MKKLFLIAIITLFSTETFAQGVVLKPSLSLQMERQSKIDKKNYFSEKRLKSQMRLAEKKAEKNAKLAQTKTPVKTPSPSISIPHSQPQINLPSYSVSSTIPGVDMNRVRATYLSWYNSTRASLSLGMLSFDSRLDTTAHDWNIEFAKGRGENHHRRNPGNSYYDFAVIDAWFLARGINPKVINRAKHTENVGYGYYYCSDSDCTDELIASIRTTYDFFMSEKGKSYDAHYRTIIQPYFTKIGMDIIVVPSEKRYYMTIHHITE